MDQIKLNSFTLPNNVIERMKSELESSRKSIIERGFSLCTTPDNNIVDKQYCIGESCRVAIERKCNGEKYVGAYHTHPGPGGNTRMSGIDMMRACLEEISCIGGDDNKIKCYIKKEIQEEWKRAARSLACYYTAEEFNNKIEVPMSKRYDHILTESAKLKNLTERSLKGEPINKEELRRQITSFGNIFNQYIKDTQKHDKRMEMLTNEFFNTVDIK